MTGTAPTNSELEIGELSQLAEAKIVDLTGELATCSALLIRLGTTFNISSLEPRSKASVLRLVFMDIVDRAYAEVIENKPDQAMARQVLTVGALIGIVPEWPNSGNRRPSAMRQQRGTDKTARRVTAAKWAGVSDRTLAPDRRPDDYAKAFQNAFHDFLADKQAVLALSRRLEIDNSVNDKSESKPPTSNRTHWPEYVPRKAIHAEFNKLVNEQGCKLIALVGLPGIGKTWLARALTRHEDGSEAPRIKVESATPRLRDVDAALASCGMDATRISSIEPSLRLTELLCNEEYAPSYVVFDNLESSDELNGLLPLSGVRPIIVATCRHIGAVSLQGFIYLRIVRMSEEEAYSLITRKLGQIKESDIRLLADSLDGYPLAISYACGLLSQSRLSVEMFCRDLKQRTDAVVAQMATEDGSILRSIIEDLILLIMDRDDLAYDLLALITFLDPILISENFLANYLMLLAGIDSSDTRYAQAMRVLEDLSIMESYEANDETNEIPDTYVSCHPLASDILRSILKGEFVEVAKTCLLLFAVFNQAYLEVYDSYPSEEDVPWSTLQDFVRFALQLKDILWRMVNGSDVATEGIFGPKIIKFASITLAGIARLMRSYGISLDEEVVEWAKTYEERNLNRKATIGDTLASTRESVSPRTVHYKKFTFMPGGRLRLSDILQGEGNDGR